MYQTPTQNYGYPQSYQTGRPTYTGNPMAYMGLKGRPIASLDEVKASMIDFDGSIFYFPDIANKRIYTKQINMDGTALINMYELKEIQEALTPTPPIVDWKSFVTKDELNAAITQLREMLLATPKGQVSPVAEPAAAAQKTPIALNF